MRLDLGLETSTGLTVSVLLAIIHVYAGEARFLAGDSNVKEYTGDRIT